jgi:membrane protease YdiL (CAAX protease family)
MEHCDRRRWSLLIEFLLIFFLLPSALLVIPFKIHKIPILLATTLIFGWLLWRDPLFDKSRFRLPQPLKPFLKMVVFKAVVVATLLSMGLLVFAPEKIFNFPHSKTSLWLIVMVIYPFLSALPQELIYRAFFFHRYQPIFPGEGQMALASVTAFAFMHIIFGNAIAPLLTIPGGYLFCRTYARTGSLPAAAIEHAAYGDIVFTVGLGVYFYDG